MIDDVLLSWVVTGLCALSAAAWGLALVGRHRSWTEVVRCGLHFAMAVAMAVMVWPWGAQLPATAPAVFFAVAALWFVTLALVPAETVPLRTVYGYHALMMLAMVWMYAFIHGLVLPHHSSTHLHAGMEMADTTASTTAGSPGWIATMNWFWFVGFVAATVFWASGLGIKRSDGSTYRSSRSLTTPAHAAMAAAMSIMFGATLFQV
ncbi:hypothetical protein A5745_02115 [Mycobacterium sp. IS-2888]|uniref:DUF5134 domain-containing protein n=1 Tax=Mycobacterium sp. IS-2888 TaxID=1834159 RepID=UPI00096F6593|nr:DUF5134 domain-containing protein [Mycobacterium sp. IS-2888]OMC52106.1 hypothetical protein A5745_02115 [Mycobacterium sp. IS-2888]